MMHRTILLVLVAVAASMPLGCGGGDGKLVVEGTVLLDGNPLSDGDIQFKPEDSKYGAEASKIKNGAYKLSIPSGKAKVEIRAFREVPGKKGPMGTEPVYERLIPSDYNDKSTLTAEVAPGKTKHDFQLKSK